MQPSKQGRTLITVLKAVIMFYVLGLLLILISVPSAQGTNSKETFQGLVISGSVLALLCSLMMLGIYFASMYYRMLSVFLLPFVILFLFNIIILSLLIFYVNNGVITTPMI